jgi:hypothetical protein
MPKASIKVLFIGDCPADVELEKAIAGEGGIRAALGAAPRSRFITARMLAGSATMRSTQFCGSASVLYTLA